MDVEKIKESSSKAWGMGEYTWLSETLRPAAVALADACAVSAGQEVLDVAAGDGNFALACAREGASVVASDLAPGMVEKGRARSEAEGYDIEWVVADAEEPPVRGRPVRVRRVGIRRDDRPAAAGGGGGAVQGGAAGQHRRDDRVDAGERRPAALRGRSQVRRARPRSATARGVGCRGHRARALRRPRQLDRDGAPHAAVGRRVSRGVHRSDGGPCADAGRRQGGDAARPLRADAGGHGGRGARMGRRGRCRSRWTWSTC